MTPLQRSSSCEDSPSTMSAELLLAGIEEAPIGIYIVDEKLSIKHVNAWALPAFGQTAPLQGRNLEEVLSVMWGEKKAGDVIAQVRKTMESGNDYVAPLFTERRKDSGELESYEWQLRPLVTPKGARGVACYFKNVTEQQRVEENLRVSAERVRSLISVATDVPWRTDSTGEFVERQEAWERFTGQTWEEHRGGGWANAIHPDDREALLGCWRSAVATTTLYESEGRIWHAKSGKWRFFTVKAVPLLDANGQVREWVGACNDVDDAYQALNELERVSRAKDDFLAALSHELRTPLTPVLMAASVSAMDRSLSDETRETFAMIRRNVELEARLIDDLLDLTRIINGKLQLERIPTDLHGLLKRTLEMVEDGSGGAQIEVDLGATRSHAEVDPARMQQVLWNLLKNAVKFTPAEGKVRVATRDSDNGRIVVSVTDNGIGISEEALPRIFQAFEQGDAAREVRFGGLGLGLAISAAITEAHGGELSADSEGLNRGSVFTLSLATIDPTGEQAVASECGADRRITKVLIVEDHEETRVVFERLLKRRGHRVTSVGSCAEAIAAFNDDEFDLVISDLGLPDKSGLDLIRSIRAIREVPAIALSGYGMEEDRLQSAEAGFSQHLVKPVEFEDLLRALDEVLG